MTGNAQQPARAKFEKLSGLSFKDPELLTVAFTHRSYVNEALAGSLQRRPWRESITNGLNFSATRSSSSPSPIISSISTPALMKAS